MSALTIFVICLSAFPVAGAPTGPSGPASSPAPTPQRPESDAPGKPLVSLTSSAGPEAQRQLDLGVQALHDFWYPEAIARFRAARELEPDLVLAYWGEAMAHQNPFQLNGADLDAMRAALAELAPTPAERAARARTERERLYLAAVEMLAGDGTVAERNRAYSDAMRRLALAYPHDLEARAFYALSLFGTVEKNLRAYPELREEAAAAAQYVLDRSPRHPGALHYAIHALDTPGTAGRVLEHARVYREVGAAPHAIHMASHIFIQHGLWPEVIDANIDAWRISVDWATDSGRDASAHAWHPADFLHYALLQAGRLREAEDWIEHAHALLEDGLDSGTVRYFLAEWIARYRVERGLWGQEPVESGYRARGEVLADGLDAIHTRDRARLAAILEEVDAKVADGRDEDGNHTVRSRRWGAVGAELRAVGAQRRGDTAAALELLRGAIDLLDGVPPPNETPDPILPPRELMGEILLDAGRPAEAVRAFRAALDRRAGRLRAMTGLARAADAAGLEHAAATAYRAVVRQLADADPDLPELAEAEAWLAAHPHVVGETG